MMSELEERSQRVISVMRGISEISHLRIDHLHRVPLGLLKEGTYGRHGVCRFKRGSQIPLGPLKVRCIDIHPLLLTEEWSRYADFVLYHEFLHALLPVSGHGPEFRDLESLWPDEGADAMGNGFRDFIRERRSDILKWKLMCPSCGEVFRTKKPMVTYMCRKCKTVLESIER